MATVAAFFLLLLYIYEVEAVLSTNSPEQGFFMITNLPEGGRQSGELYIYAVHGKTSSEGIEAVRINKEGGLPSIVETGVIEEEGAEFGCFLRVHPPPKWRGVRFGTYTAEIPSDDDSALTAYTFVKPESKRLDTGGVYTVTIYPAMEGALSPLSEGSPRSIGVRKGPRSAKIKWSKDRTWNVLVGPRLNLMSTEDAGLYTIRRRSRAKRGWFVQIRVIASDCPPDQFLYPDSATCTPRTDSVDCKNGGVGRNDADECICPPLLAGTDCSDVVPVTDDDGEMVIGISEDEASYLECKDLPGGNEFCKGYLFCFGDLYGCTCGSGWFGNNCDKPCPKGKWGASCNQGCPNGPKTDCDRYFGISSTGGI